MEHQRFVVRGTTYACGDPNLQRALELVHGSSERPRCMCVQAGVPMYVARHGGDYVVKRMPDSGARHQPSCPAYEPEAASSGLGELVGEAIIEHSPEEVELRTDFALSRAGGKTMPKGEATEDPAEVRAPRRRMSLRAMLHYLYEAAGFNRWHPAMEGRRNQGVLHKYLMQAAKSVVVKGSRLDERLYVPEPFRLEQKEEIGARRRHKLSLLQSMEGRAQFKMAIVIGEYNGSEATNLGQRIMVRHMADAPLYMEAKAWRKAERSYGAMLRARDADVERKPRVLMAALIYGKSDGLYHVDTLSVMLATDQWIPLDGLHQLPLVEALQRERRMFLKPLRYDAKTAAGFPDAILLDCGPASVALHVINPQGDPKEIALKEKVIGEVGTTVWKWSLGEDMPALPEPLRPEPASLPGSTPSAERPDRWQVFPTKCYQAGARKGKSAFEHDSDTPTESAHVVREEEVVSRASRCTASTRKSARTR